MGRILRTIGVGLVLGTLTFGVTGASAHGFGGGFHGGGFHGFHGGWGHGWGHGGWGYGWRYRGIAFRPFGGCAIRPYVNVYGELVARRVCF